MCPALDYLLLKVDEDDPGIEIMIRRFVGLQLIEEGKSWQVAEALQRPATLVCVPRDAVRSAMREASLVEKLKQLIASSDRKQSRSYDSSSSGRGRGSRSKNWRRSKRGDSSGSDRKDNGRGSAAAAGRGSAASSP
jgi:hypothetical protein